MTEHAGAAEVPEFYDSLAPEYDGMTGFGTRFVREKPFFRLIVQNHGIASALDAGCGTGFHSLLLAQLGVSVTALDVSEEMLGLLERHAHEMGLAIRRVHSDFRNLRNAAPGPFDALFCMGNTLPHLLKEADMQAAIAGFAEVLIPGGTLVLQMINYDRVLATRERILGAREHNGTTYVRFYDFDDAAGLIRFNVLRLEREKESVKTRLITIPLAPVTSARIVHLLEICGYERIRTFGSIAMDPFDPAISRDVLIIASRPGA